MNYKLLTSILLITFSAFAQNYPDGKTILEKVDQNMASDNRIIQSKMVVHGKRQDRVIESKGWSVGIEKSLTEYLSPAREAGTKMLKLDDQLWIYSPSSDRIIQLSGHMLRQSVMGSDLSYEDMMEDKTLADIYNVKVTEEDQVNARKCWVLELTAKTEDIAYQKQKMWIDQERYIPLKQEMYAKSGQLLKKTELSDVAQIDGRWFPRKMTYKDMLKNGEGTEFIITDIKFNQDIPEYLFSKASLKK